MNIIVLCLLTINLVYIKKIYALPAGVDRVEIGNWTKTREVNEVGGDERKLNSEAFTNIQNINMGDDIDNIEIFTNLYDTAYNMRTVNTLNSIRTQEISSEVSSVIKGNKILRTKARSSEPIYSFDYTTIKTWIGSDISTVWEEDLLGNKIITWPCYVEVLDNTSQAEAPVEWRMIEGKFNLSSEEIKLIKTNMIQPVIGIETNNDEEFKLICPFNDFLNVFINKKLTHINYRSMSDYYKFKIDKNLVNYRYTNLVGNEKYCNKEMDKHISQHTHGNHIDCNILGGDVSNNYYKMEGDISKYITSTTSQYTISLLVGQVGRYGEDISSYGGGISKINLYLIRNPQFDVNIKPYIIKDDTKIYINSDYKFSYNEEILFDIEIINSSEYYDYNNLNLDIDLIEKINGNNKNDTESFHIDKNSSTYKNENITESVKVYINDDDTPKSISDLSHLNKGDKLVISSDKLRYTVTENNAATERINYNYSFEFNYLNDYTFYKYENTKRLNVKPIGGRLTVTVNSDKEDYFYIKLSGEDNFSNIKVKNNRSYTICNLDYDKEYKLSLINSSSYKPEISQTFTLKNLSGYNTKSITINASKKYNNYFTQRKIDEIIINR